MDKMGPFGLTCATAEQFAQWDKFFLHSIRLCGWDEQESAEGGVDEILFGIILKKIRTENFHERPFGI